MKYVILLLCVLLFPYSTHAATRRRDYTPKHLYVKKYLIQKPSDWMWPLNSFFKAPQYKGHFGYDLNSADSDTGCGESVKAAEAGEIIELRMEGWNHGYGNTILLKHNNGLYSRYAHLKAVTVFSGHVDKGQEIGYMGRTGNTWGRTRSGKPICHLHFEMYHL